MLTQPFLLQLQLAPEGNEDDRNREQSAPVSDHDRAAQKEQQESGVDGVADEAVGPALDEFVIMLELDRGAPVTTEKCAGIDAQRSTGHAKGETGRVHGRGVRQDLLP